jgi:ABC-type branched-subunit amino acid transport system ATPase component
MEVAFEVAQHITVLHQGRLLADGSPLRKEEGLSMLLVQQNPPFALKLADYVYVMSKGRSVYEPPPQILAQNEDVKARHLGI